MSFEDMIFSFGLFDWAFNDSKSTWSNNQTTTSIVVPRRRSLEASGMFNLYGLSDENIVCATFDDACIGDKQRWIEGQINLSSSGTTPSIDHRAYSRYGGYAKDVLALNRVLEMLKTDASDLEGRYLDLELLVLIQRAQTSHGAWIRFPDRRSMDHRRDWFGYLGNPKQSNLRNFRVQQ
ncbi:hypothetical protein HAX54_039690 [Datura stramonium]|uniref:Uncharacterized protein n=1 Tax=Datura stramonium TaxID=4076 RepID=A0ABS8VMA5_DATST|nr:hypothetical protein [Datura stramonium]